METQFTNAQPPMVASRIKLVIGIFFTLLGILLTLDNLGVPDADRVLRYWPVGLIGLGVLLWNESRILAGIAGTVGALLLATTARWVRVSIFDLWPIALIAFGVSIVLRAISVAPSNDNCGTTITAVATNRKLARRPADLDGRRIVASLGGAEITLLESDAPTEDIRIEVFALWGGIEMRVPAGWEVVSDVVPIMGGCDTKTGPAKGGRRVTITGLVLMSGMEVKQS
ncbi:MAG: hypothetical protein JOZ54_18260 [Acidobacteria bacterium]|nr:hypothetical protein [Acidobacteriota bacterium]